MSLPAARPVPVIVLTGFLGAGKTTLLNGLLRHAALADTAVIINEFGEIGIDHWLVDRIEGGLLLLTTGCLCCAARGDLITALADLLTRRARGEIGFERIVIETTGLADPGPVLNALLPNTAFGDALRLDRLITVVDAEAGAETLARSEEAVRQVALADLLVLSKFDRLSPEGLGAVPPLEGSLRRLNPTAPILPSSEPDRVIEALQAAAPPIDGTMAHRDDRHHHDHLTGLATTVLRAGALDSRTFEGFLDRVLRVHGAKLLRLKGLVSVRGDAGRPVVINVVQHRIHPTSILPAWPDADHDTRLVVIATPDAARGIADLWQAFFGPLHIDRPDAAALSLDTGPGLF